MKRLIPILWIVVVLAMGAAGYLLLWELPRDAAARLEDIEKQVEIENSYRATGAQIFLGLGLFLGIVLTYRRIRAIERQAQSAERQARTAEQGQITERFTRAIEQLGQTGDEHTAIRLGGIYALERIMRDSEDDAPTVQEVLAAFVRDESIARWRLAGSEAQPEPEYLEDAGHGSSTNDSSSQPDFRISHHTDLQAALTVLGRNPIEGRQIDLRQAHLEAANLTGAHFQGANLSEAYLNGADLAKVHLEGANLAKADLGSASLHESHLEGANLGAADLDGALLVEAHLNGAKLSKTNLRDGLLIRANLEKAWLWMADLKGADLSWANLQNAYLRDADLNGVNLQGANLIGANVRGTAIEARQETKDDD